ncbi:hypothetical protein OSTOST_18334, partial [Ostertagia ostertagi]
HDAVFDLRYESGLEGEGSGWDSEDNFYRENAGSAEPKYCGERCKRLAEEGQYLADELRRAKQYKRALEFEGKILEEQASFQKYLNEQSRRRIEMDNELSRVLQEENKILLARIRTYLPSFEPTDLMPDLPTTTESDVAESE